MRKLEWSVLLIAGSAATGVSAASLYPSMAPLAQYLSARPADEIALAKSAAPASISAGADILVFGAHGYHRAAKGSNGFTCLVQRSWSNNLDNEEFWNPRVLAPICLNQPASRTVLPFYLKRTRLVLAGTRLADIAQYSKQHPAPDPAPGSMAIMMSKDGYLADGVGAAGPHIMVYYPRLDQSLWASNSAGVPIGATTGDRPSITIYYVTVPKWSDGSVPVRK